MDLHFIIYNLSNDLLKYLAPKDCVNLIRADLNFRDTIQKYYAKKLHKKYKSSKNYLGLYNFLHFSKMYIIVYRTVKSNYLMFLCPFCNTVGSEAYFLCCDSCLCHMVCPNENCDAQCIIDLLGYYDDDIIREERLQEYKIDKGTFFENKDEPLEDKIYRLPLCKILTVANEEETLSCYSFNLKRPSVFFYKSSYSTFIESHEIRSLSKSLFLKCKSSDGNIFTTWSPI